MVYSPFKHHYCRAPWCEDNDGNAKYCHGDIEVACKELEGTQPVDTELCPCLSGGDWTLMGRQMSYCQLGSCPKTHNVLNKNNWAKCGKKVTAFLKFFFSFSLKKKHQSQIKKWQKRLF